MSVSWPFNSSLALYYKWSIVTMRPTCTNMVKGRHRSRDHSTGSRTFPMKIWRLKKIMGSRPWLLGHVHRYEDMKPQMLEGRTHVRTGGRLGFLRAKASIAGIAFVLATVIPSVRLSVTTRYQYKTRWDRDFGFSPYDSLLSLVFRDKISSRWVKGMPSNEKRKRGTPFKKRYFTVIGSFNVKIVADRNRHAAYHNKHWCRAP